MFDKPGIAPKRPLLSSGFSQSKSERNVKLITPTGASGVQGSAKKCKTTCKKSAKTMQNTRKKPAKNTKQIQKKMKQNPKKMQKKCKKPQGTYFPIHKIAIERIGVRDGDQLPRKEGPPCLTHIPSTPHTTGTPRPNPVAGCRSPSARSPCHHCPSSSNGGTTVPSTHHFRPSCCLTIGGNDCGSPAATSLPSQSLGHKGGWEWSLEPSPPMSGKMKMTGFQSENFLRQKSLRNAVLAKFCNIGETFMAASAKKKKLDPLRGNPAGLGQGRKGRLEGGVSPPP